MALVTLLLCMGILYAVSPGVRVGGTFAEARTIGAGQPTFDEILQRFDILAKEKGAEYAFNVLRVAQLPHNTDIHLVAHTIGHQLYLQEGVEGMSVCSQEFRNGCSHSLVVELLQERGDGDEVRALIDDACKKAPGGSNAYAMCYHGLGHGVFAFYGFTLPKTVAFCEKTGTAVDGYVQSDECIGGAIMELVGGGGHDREKWLHARALYLKSDDPLRPCNTDAIPLHAKGRCYVYMTPHYLESVGATLESFTPEQMMKAMEACTSLPYGADRSACAGSFGKDFAGIVGQRDVRKLDVGEYSDEQLRTVVNLCKLTPDRNDVVACESYALSTFFWGGDAKPELAVRFCAILSDEVERDFCFHTLADNLARFIQDPSVRKDRCEMLEKKYRSHCL